MIAMKKVVLDKSEDIADAIDHILEFPDPSVVLVVPRGSALGRSARNFHLLRREMESASKQLEIESVDEQILALAKEAGIPGRHPLLTKGSGSVSDIVAIAGERSSTRTVLKVPADEEEDDAKPKKGAKGRRGAKAEETPSVRVEIEEENEVAAGVVVEPEAIVDADDDDAEDGGGKNFFGGARFFKERNPALDEGDDDEGDGVPSRKRPWRGIVIAIVAIAIAGAAFFAVTNVFGHANVSINFAKTPWQYGVTFTGDKSISQPNASGNTVPAQVFFETKNVTQLFPASASANVSVKARGTLTIYNAYSSASQDLVASTRFVTPDGKIFRLASQVVVPGAKVTNGQIVPSSITAQIVADQPGPDYNVGAVDKLTIPGFQNTPKYNAFYGALPNGTSGGFTGMKAVPSMADITAAKASTTALLQNALKSLSNFDIPSNFKILDGATNAQITRLSVNTSTDQNGNFSVFGQISFQAIGFDESMVKSVLLAHAQDAQASSTFSSLTLSYTNVKPDFTNGRMAFTVSAQGSLMPAFDADSWKPAIAGMKVQDAQAVIAALPHLADGKISVWPVWLWNIPANPNKINVAVQ